MAVLPQLGNSGSNTRTGRDRLRSRARALAHTWVSVFLTSGLRAPRTAEHSPGRYALSAASGTHTKKHMYNQHTRGMVKTGHRSLVERGGRKAFVRDKGLAHMQKRKKRKKEGKKEIRMSEKNVIHESKEKVQDLPAKLPDYFLRSDKSNINQFAI